MRRNFLLIVLCLFLNNCSNQNNDKFLLTEKSINIILVKGLTTKNQVNELFGRPDDIDFHRDGSEKWVYYQNNTSSKTVDFIPIINLCNQNQRDSKRKMILIFLEDILVDYSIKNRLSY